MTALLDSLDQLGEVVILSASCNEIDWIMRASEAWFPDLVSRIESYPRYYTRELGQFDKRESFEIIIHEWLTQKQRATQVDNISILSVSDRPRDRDDFFTVMNKRRGVRALAAVFCVSPTLGELDAEIRHLTVFLTRMLSMYVKADFNNFEFFLTERNGSRGVSVQASYFIRDRLFTEPLEAESAASLLPATLTDYRTVQTKPKAFRAQRLVNDICEQVSTEEPTMSSIIDDVLEIMSGGVKLPPIDRSGRSSDTNIEGEPSGVPPPLTEP